MGLEERYQQETAKWDQLAENERQSLGTLPVELDFHKYARSSEMLPGVSEFLGNLKGKKILEYGCGFGLIAVLLAKSGGDVTAFDLSSGCVLTTAKQVKLNNVQAQVDLTIAGGEYTPFAKNSFELIFGKSILHHLLPVPAKDEIFRLLKPGGKAVFIETLGMNFFLNFARAYLPYKYRPPRGVDKALTYKDIDLWFSDYSEYRFQEIQLFSMLERAFGWETEFMFLRKLDAFLLKRVKFLRRFCRYVVIYAIK